MTKTPYKERAWQRREQEILQITRQIMAEKGFPNLNMDEVAEAVGISKPTLYQHFSTKEALIVSVIQMHYDEFEADLTQNPDQSALQQIEHAVRRMIERRFSSGSIHANFRPEIVALVHSNETLKLRREQIMQTFHELIDRAKAEGSITPDIPTPMIARMVFCLQGTLIDHSRPDHQIEVDQLDQAISHAIQLLMNGIRS